MVMKFYYRPPQVQSDESDWTWGGLSLTRLVQTKFEKGMEKVSSHPVSGDEYHTITRIYGRPLPPQNPQKVPPPKDFFTLFFQNAQMALGHGELPTVRFLTRAL